MDRAQVYETWNGSSTLPGGTGDMVQGGPLASGARHGGFDSRISDHLESKLVTGPSPIANRCVPQGMAFESSALRCGRSQKARRLVVIQLFAGSIPAGHPILFIPRARYDQPRPSPHSHQGGPQVCGG